MTGRYREEPEETPAAFASYWSYRSFAHAASGMNRFLRSAQDNAFLDAVRETMLNRAITFDAGTHLWRAQVGHESREEPFPLPDGTVSTVMTHTVQYPFAPERMKPLPDKAREGRANPKGVPVLYLSVEKKTAASEVRPWNGAIVSLARMRLEQNVFLINCVGPADQPYTLLPPPGTDEPPPEVRERYVWKDIDKAFSEPVSGADDVADYVPTQILSELFREYAFSGLLYRSSFGGGHNVALFEPAVATVVARQLIRVAIQADVADVGPLRGVEDATLTQADLEAMTGPPPDFFEA